MTHEEIDRLAGDLLGRLHKALDRGDKVNISLHEPVRLADPVRSWATWEFTGGLSFMATIKPATGSDVRMAATAFNAPEYLAASPDPRKPENQERVPMAPPDPYSWVAPVVFLGLAALFIVGGFACSIVSLLR